MADNDKNTTKDSGNKNEKVWLIVLGVVLALLLLIGVVLALLLLIGVLFLGGYLFFNVRISEMPDVLPPKTDDELVESCVDMCGDGVCQEMVCLSTDCPCVEDEVSCPEDCEDHDEQGASGSSNESGDESRGASSNGSSFDEPGKYYNWNVYENESLGVKFRYPYDWELDGGPLLDNAEDEGKNIYDYADSEVLRVNVSKKGAVLNYSFPLAVPGLCKFDDYEDSDMQLYVDSFSSEVNMTIEEAEKYSIDFSEYSYTEINAFDGTNYRIIDEIGSVCSDFGKDHYIETGLSCDDIVESTDSLSSELVSTRNEILKTFEFISTD